MRNETKAQLIGIPLVGIVIPLLFNVGEPFMQMLPWMIASLIITTLAWVVTPKAARAIYRRYPWETSAFRHILVKVLVLLVIGTTMSLVLYATAEITKRYTVLEVNDKGMSISYFISFLLLFFITTIYDLGYVFHKWKKAIIEAERLEKEKALSQYQALKNQVNPHFLFNSLSVLSSLIYPEPKPEKAKKYLDEFSRIYRYVLDVNDETVVTLQRELDFLHSFLYLLSIRYGEDLQTEMHIPADKMDTLLPPLTLQFLIENAIKHNQVDKRHPLAITIAMEGQYLVVSNNLNPKPTPKRNSNRLALNNLKGRYALITDETPLFYATDKDFICKVPLIEED